MNKTYLGTSHGCTRRIQQCLKIPLKKEILPSEPNHSIHFLPVHQRLIKKKIFPLLCLLIGFFGFSQTEVYFKYDEAGNQKYRGPESAARQVSSEAKTTLLTGSHMMDEKTFWKQIRLYPVPVNDVLTIDWTEEVDGLIESVSLYQHSNVHWKFQQQNLPDLNRQLKINMTGYDWGIYVIRFTLKDGKVFSKNITKR